LAGGGRSGPLLWISLAAVGLSLVLYLGLRITVSAGVGSVVDRIRAINVP
jgi:hypothetical protein